MTLYVVPIDEFLSITTGSAKNNYDRVCKEFRAGVIIPRQTPIRSLVIELCYTCKVYLTFEPPPPANLQNEN